MQTTLPLPQIAELCLRYHVTELALFGSRLDGTASEDSDYDFLVVFAPDSRVGLFEFVDLRAGLASLLGRPVDLVSKDAIRNPFFREAALSRYEVVYAGE
jgi:uncharacterized protein